MEEKKLVPKLRFPGFTEPWEQRKLGDVIASLYNGQTPSRFDKANWEGDIPWLTSGELNRGVVNHSIEKITPQGRDDANLKIVPKGTVVIAITGLEAAGTRGNCAKLGFDTTLNQSCMAIYPKSEFLDPDFLFQWYIAVGEEYGIKYTQGTKQQSYNAELIKILPISVPRVTEQRKITRILDSFDDIITLHQRKLEHLKLKKKSLLQKLFPKEGEVYPEFRFPGFTDPWEQRKFGELFLERREKTTEENEDILLSCAITGIYLNSDLFSHFRGSSTVGYLKVRKNDLILSAQNLHLGNANINFNFEHGMISPAYKVFEIESCDPYFVNAWVKKESTKIFFLKATTEGASQCRKNIDWDALINQELLTPNALEQETIGKFFNQLDRYITLHQRKLEHLQLLKKALLQQLFV